ncbi:MAG: hypothetical protein NTZ97_00480 [Candidatus Moranbacteria bacterium]|nr:hypothetical protein [Candidatus Moranbacteria bacterium]
MKSTKDSRIIIETTNPLDEAKEIKTIDVPKSNTDLFQEMLFPTDGNRTYSDILFEKTNKTDGANISVSDIQISKLNVISDKEFANFKPTIKGEIDYNIPLLEQTVNSRNFDQLKDPDIIFGQLFKASADYITAIELDMDIIKQSNNGGSNYKLQLREVNYEEGGPPEIRSIVLADLGFSVDDLAKYRQADGKYKFPLFAKVEKDKYYFIGIDNGKIDANQFNYLRLKGNPNGEIFQDGILAVKTKGLTYSTTGDLYFKFFGIKFNEYNGTRILGGTVISDIGRGKGTFKYQPRGNGYDLADLNSYTSDISFDSVKKSFEGEIKTNQASDFSYKFETIFPFAKFHIFAKQPDVTWNQTSILYSFDQKNWQEIPSIEANEILPNEQKIQGIQAFDSTISELIPKNIIYLKFQPKNIDPEKKSWGIGNFIFEADLKL